MPTLRHTAAPRKHVVSRPGMAERRSGHGALQAGRLYFQFLPPQSRPHEVQSIALRPGPDEPLVTEIWLKPNGIALQGHFKYSPNPVQEPSVKELKELALTAK